MAELPEPDWLTLEQARKFVAHAANVDIEKAGEALIDAFHNNRIDTRGRCERLFKIDGRCTLGDFHWDRAVVDWQGNTLARPGGKNYLDGEWSYVFTDVGVRRRDIEQWLDRGDGEAPAQDEPDAANDQIGGRPSSKGLIRETCEDLLKTGEITPGENRKVSREKIRAAVKSRTGQTDNKGLSDRTIARHTANLFR